MLFPLFPLEIERIHPVAHAMGLGDAWRAKTKTSPAFVEAMQRLFPGEEAAVASLFPAGGEHTALAVDELGRCVFLGDAGCVLTRAERPAHCVLYPLWVVGGRIVPFEAQDCLAVREARTTGGLMMTLGLDGETLRASHASLRQAWGL